MRLVLLNILFLANCLTSSCGTEIGNGDKQKGKTDSSQKEGGPAASGGNGSETFNSPVGSPYNDVGATTVPVLGALINYCNSPGKDLSAAEQSFSSDNLTVTAKQFEITVSYKTGYKESAAGTRNENFLVGLSTFACTSFSQETGKTIAGVSGTFTRKTQVLTDPTARQLEVTWYIDDDGGKIARIELIDSYNTIILANDDYEN